MPTLTNTRARLEYLGLYGRERKELTSEPREDQRRPGLLVVGPAGEPFWDGLASLTAHFEIVIGNDEETVARAFPDAEIIYMWDNWAYLARFWDSTRALRWVHCAWAGVDRVLFPSLLESDVVLTRTAGVYGAALAEYALTGMLYFAKRLPELLSAQRERAWRKFNVSLLAGKTLVVVGLGDVGATVAAKARALGMRVIGVRRRGGDSNAGVDRVLGFDDLDTALAEADYLVMCLPLTPRTEGLIGAKELARLKPGAVLVNIARGGVVDEAALLEALHEGRLGGAVVDVFEQEPLPPESPYFDAPNLLLSSHTVDTVAGWEQRAVSVFVDNVRRYLAGQQLANVVDKNLRY